MTIDEKTMRAITADAINGANMDESTVDYSQDENVAAYVAIAKEAKSMKPGQVIENPENGVDSPSEEMMAYAREHYMGMSTRERRYAPGQPRDPDGKFEGGGGWSYDKTGKHGELDTSKFYDPKGDDLRHGGTANIAASFASDLKEPDSGFTMNPRTGNPPPGTGDGKGDGPYAVAIGRPSADIIEPTPGMFQRSGNGLSQVGQRLATFVRENARQLSQPNMWLGAWHNPDDGKIYLDVTEVFPKGSLESATAAGSARDQIAITDLSTFKSIPTGGSGRV